MNNGYDQFIGQLSEAVDAYPSLYESLNNERKILKGSLPIVDKNGKHWEDYEIEIHFSEKFPDEFPTLFETSGKIPKIADWHVYEDTFSCCVKVRPEEILRCKNGITIKEYISEEVLPYLFNQTHRRVEGYYVNGEYSHGAKGIYEFYSQILKTGNDIKHTLQLMDHISTHDRPYRTNKCFCGSNQKFRHCHRLAFDVLKNIGDNIVRGHVYEIAKAAKLI